MDTYNHHDWEISIHIDWHDDVTGGAPCRDRVQIPEVAVP